MDYDKAARTAARTGEGHRLLAHLLSKVDEARQLHGEGANELGTMSPDMLMHDSDEETFREVLADLYARVRPPENPYTVETMESAPGSGRWSWHCGCGRRSFMGSQQLVELAAKQHLESHD